MTLLMTSYSSYLWDIDVDVKTVLTLLVEPRAVQVNVVHVRVLGTGWGEVVSDQHLTPGVGSLRSLLKITKRNASFMNNHLTCHCTKTLTRVKSAVSLIITCVLCGIKMLSSNFSGDLEFFRT